jgi:hypothetical protein
MVSWSAFFWCFVPALAAHAAPRHLRLAAGYVFGFTGYVLGRLASATYDFPIGPPSSAYSPLLALPPQWCWVLSCRRQAKPTLSAPSLASIGRPPICVILSLNKI